jgi:hypothetical protein
VFELAYPLTGVFLNVHSAGFVEFLRSPHGGGRDAPAWRALKNPEPEVSSEKCACEGIRLDDGLIELENHILLDFVLV